MEEEIRLGNRDRGWNDPPSMSYSQSSQAQGTTPRKNLLNQRVAMPQNYPSPIASGKQPSTGGLPNTISTHSTPPPSTNSTPPPPSGPLSSNGPPPSQGGISSGGPNRAIKDSLSPGRPSSGGEKESEADDVTCDATLALLKNVLEQCQNCLQKRVISDVERRLKLLEDSWKKNKLSLPVQKRTGKLAADLQARRYDSAHEIHLSLMVDHITEVSQWMVGVKRLIHEARTHLPYEDKTCDGDSSTNTVDGPGTTSLDQEKLVTDLPTAKGDAPSSQTSPGPEEGDSTEESRNIMKTDDNAAKHKDGPGTIEQDQEPSKASAPSAENDASSSDVSPRPQESDGKEEPRTDTMAADSCVTSGVENIDISRS